MTEPDPAAVARAIIDANLYLVLGTADESGNPWVSPVYFASSAFRDFFWVSSPEATHSRNVARRPEVSIVIFDSQAAIDSGQAVYMSAHAEQVEADEHGNGIEIFSRRSQRHGGRPWSPADVEPPARLRLYRASASAHYVLLEGDQRVQVNL
ncbi:MAG TPA: pyridoxamine 5'-phosphate oxidase family protein [Gaiellaceae bacterium]|nr:pyridoxamine 5'-phosphate oxidase family protein [Gaiellaceae bacterium]